MTNVPIRTYSRLFSYYYYSIINITIIFELFSTMMDDDGNKTAISGSSHENPKLFLRSTLQRSTRNWHTN